MPSDATTVVPAHGRIDHSTGSNSKAVNLKVIGVCAVLLLAAMMYNSMGGAASFQSHGVRGAVHEAALPLQKRPRKSKYDHGVDPDAPEVVVTAAPAAAAAATSTSATPATTPAASAVQLSMTSAASAATPPQQVSSFAAQVDSAARALTKDLDGLSCHARENSDLAGDAAYVWGLAFNVASAAECCAACASQRQLCGQPGSRGKPFWRASQREHTQGRCSGAPGVCNAWVFCPGSDDTRGAEDRCFSYTIHNHSKGECWLKHESNESYPIAAGPTLPLRMRQAPRRDWPWAVAVNVWPWEVPEKIAWQAGLLATKGAPVWRSTRLPDWHHKFCNGRYGPC